jgi:hypothetical protein
MTNDVETRLSIHEAVCAERYATIMARLGATQKIIVTATFLLVTGMGGVIVTLAMKGMG